MAASLVVRINPDDQRVAVDTQDGTRTSHIGIGDGFWKSLDDIDGWERFEVELPTPRRRFKPGDVVDAIDPLTARKERLLRMRTDWYEPFQDKWIGGDSQVCGKPYVFIGNIADLV